MKRVLFFMMSAAFMLGLSSCDQNDRKCADPKKCPEKTHQKEVRHERKW